MRDIITNKIEQEKLEIEQKKLEIEVMKFEHSKVIDEKKLKSDRSAKFWAQVSIFTPIIILVIGFFLNSYSEQSKREEIQKEEQVRREQAQIEETKKAKRQFIEKQLAEFYYPIQFRLNKDKALFQVWTKNKKVSNNIKIVKKIEKEFVLPNHEEIIKIIDTHFDLIKNDSDIEAELRPLIEAMQAYERHVAVYRALIENGDSRKPIHVDEPFPKPFFTLIGNRTAELENQRDGLLP